MTLRDEIRSDPLQIGYMAMPPEAVLASLTAPTRSRVVSRMVTARAILSDCNGVGVSGSAILDKLEAAGQSISAVKWAMKFLGQDGGLDAGSPATRTMIVQLQQGGVLTSAEAASLLALSVKPCSRLEELGLPTPIEAEIIEAQR